MIKISSPEQQLRQNQAMLLLIGGISSLGGLLVWSATPFAANNPKDPVHVSLRYIALVSGLVAGASAVACGAKLEKIAPLIQAVDMAEARDFLKQLAAAEYVQAHQHKAEAKAILSPARQVESQIESQNGSAISSSSSKKVTETVTDAVSMVPAVSQAVTNSERNQVTTAESAAENAESVPGESAESAKNAVAELASFKGLYFAVKEAEANGVSESTIIKEVLGQTGRNYANGRKMLETLDILAEKEGWG